MQALIAQRLTIFWWMMAVVAVPAAYLSWRYLAMIGQGYVGDRAGESAGVLGLLRAALRGPAVGWRRFFRHLFLDGLGHRRLWQRSKGRWFAHAAILLGFLGLAILSFLAALAEHILLPLGLRSPLVAALRDMDQPFMAALHESLGLILLLGGLMAGLRRFLWPGRDLPNERPDVLALSLLLFITVSGYPLESLRLLAQSLPAAVARYSYIGWPIAKALAPLSLPWAAWHFWAFQVHVLASVALFIYWPVSKMMHVIVGPLVAALGAAEGQPTR
ncbi:MAG: respiratory nitrate reductase subunit gamma [Anaerolineae bacterium]